MVNGKALEGISLMLTFVGLLVFPGIVIVNLQNSGLVNNAQCNSTTDCSNIETCNGNVCTLTANAGCQAVPTACNLQGSVVQFLNQCSPFTNILTLNFGGFVNSFFTSCGNSVAQSIPGSTNGGTPAGTTGTLTSCSQSGIFNGVNSYVCIGTSTFPAPWSNLGFVSYNGGAALNFCIVQGDNCNAVLRQNAGQQNPSTDADATCTLSSSTFTCTLLTILPPSQTASLSATSILTFFLTIFGGVLIAILASGIGINIGGTIIGTGGTTGLSSNPQGTKLAQTLGIGLFLWSPLYSMFSSWFSSGFLPYGLDNSGSPIGLGIVGTVLIGGFFWGTYGLSQTSTPK